MKQEKIDISKYTLGIDPYDKQETLEEAAERLFPFTKDDSENRIITIKRLSWIDGAKWQQERMYSEEDLKEAFKSCYTPFSFDRIGDLEQDFNNWFEQFKKGGNNEQQ